MDPGEGLRLVLPARAVDRDRARPVRPGPPHRAGRRGQAGLPHLAAAARRRHAGLVRLARHDAAARRRDPHRHAGRRRADERRADRVGDHRGHRHADATRCGRDDRSGPCPLRPVADRRPARRQRPQRAVQLGVRPARTAARSCSGSRTPTPPAAPRSPSAAWSSSCAGSASTGTRAPRSAARTRRTCSRSGWTIYRDAVARLLDGRLRLRLRTRTDEEVDGPPGRARRQDPGLRQPRPRADRRAGRRVPGRGPHAGGAVPDAGRAGRVRRTWSAARSGSSRRTCRTSCSPAPTAARSTRSTNPVDDALMGITHVLRGEDLLPSTPRQIALYAALRVARHRVRADAAVRAPADGARRGPAAAVQAQDAGGVAGHLRAEGFLPEGDPQLPRAARLVARRRPGALHARRDGRGVRRRRRSTATRPAST